MIEMACKNYALKEANPICKITVFKPESGVNACESKN